MEKIDLKQQWKQLYNPPASTPVFIDVPPLNYLMIDGHGDPNTSQNYANAVEALYALAYALKFSIKKAPGGVDYAVMPLEGLWWVDDMRQFSVERKEDWQWTMMILQPEWITSALVNEITATTRQKKDLILLPQVRFERFVEGKCAQIMHIGPYSAEQPTISRLHNLIEEHGYLRRGKHHEIYLKDPRKSAPEALKTIIRQPVAEASID